jgi:hypothetical protein
MLSQDVRRLDAELGTALGVDLTGFSGIRQGRILGGAAVLACGETVYFGCGKWLGLVNNSRQTSISPGRCFETEMTGKRE